MDSEERSRRNGGRKEWRCHRHNAPPLVVWCQTSTCAEGMEKITTSWRGLRAPSRSLPRQPRLTRCATYAPRLTSERPQPHHGVASFETAWLAQAAS